MTGDPPLFPTRGEIFRDTLRHFLAPVADLLYEDETVTEVLINGPDSIYVERRGRLERTERHFADEDSLEAAVVNLAEYVHRQLDERHHSMDARLPEPEKFRVHVIIPPCSRNGIVVSIRKFKRSELNLKKLVELRTISEAAAQFLDVAIKLHRNIIIAGGTGAGKTSLLNALSELIPANERIVVIEDSSELQLRQPHSIYLESRPPSDDGTGGVTIRDLFVDSLRMRPDRIIVGEVRRGEALDLIQSMLSGHDGAMSTVHASNPRMALVRLETLCLLSDVGLPVYVARTQLASAIHLIVQIARGPTDRRITAISEVRGLDERDRYILADLYKISRQGPNRTEVLVPTGEQSSFRNEVREMGFAEQAPLCSQVPFGP